MTGKKVPRGAENSMIIKKYQIYFSNKIKNLMIFGTLEIST